MKKILVGILALLLIAPSTVAAGNKPTPATWSYMRSFDIAYIVEQQTPCLPDGTSCGATNPDPSLWVTNSSTTCAWDPDDQMDAILGWGGRILDPGQSATGHFCLITDITTHLVELDIPIPELSGTLTVGDFSISSSGGHKICIVAPEYQSLSGLPLIPNSNGGVGKTIDISFTVANNTTKRVRNAWATASMAYAGFEPVSPCNLWPYHVYGQRVVVENGAAEMWWWIEDSV